jgi:competence protein ComEC
VSHHGSADQDSGLYAAVDAEIALIGVGADNDYGHPRASLLSMLTAQGSVVARSDRDGLAAVWADGDGLHLWRDRGVAAPE